MKFFSHILFTFTLLLLGFSFSFAQKLTLSGVIKDGQSQELLSFASVRVEGTTMGANSNLDGEYSLNLAPGKYTISVKYAGYKPYLDSIEIKRSGYFAPRYPDGAGQL